MRLSVKEMMYSKLRYGLIAAIIFLLAFLVLFVSGLARGLADDNAAALEHIGETADYLAINEEAEQNLTRSLLDDHQLQGLASSHEGEDPIPFGLQQAVVHTEEDSIDTTVFYVDEDSPTAPSVTEGRAPAAEGEALADVTMKQEGAALGDTIIEEESGLSVTITGWTEGQTYSHTPVLFVQEEDWLDYSGGEEPAVSGAALIGWSEEAEAADVAGVDILPVDDALEGIPGYTAEQGSLSMMIVFLYIISAVVLAAFFYVLTLQKLDQLGILKAIGAGTASLAVALVFQVMLLSAISVSAATGVVIGASAFLPDGMPFVLSFELVGTMAALFLGVAAAGSLLSIYKVHQVDPLDAMKGGA